MTNKCNKLLSTQLENLHFLIVQVTYIFLDTLSLLRYHLSPLPIIKM